MSASVPDYVTKPLLTRIIESSLDSDYQAAALQPPSEGRRRSGALIALLLFGLLVGVAIVQTTRQADSASAGRAALVQEIGVRRARLAAQQRRLDRLTADVTQLTGTVNDLGDRLNAVRRRSDRLGQQTGFAAVSGPGLTVTVSDAPGVDAAGAVRAEDLAILVDALYNAGAEAVSINDQRLTALTSLHNSGNSIGIDQVSLKSPYVVKALGEPRTLAPRLQESTHGLRWVNLVAQLGFGFEVLEQRRVVLPAAAWKPLTQAAPRARGERDG